MRPNITRTIWKRKACAAALLWLAVDTAVASSLSYVVTDLGTLGGAASSAQGIDDDDMAVGWSTTTSGARRAFLARDRRITDLGTLAGGSYSQATAINGRGKAAGYGGINEYGPSFSEVTQAFLWSNGVMQSLGALYCPCSFSRRYGTSLAHDINAAGQVVGESETVRGEWVRHAFLWHGGSMQDIGGGAGDWSISRAFAINDRGQVVGDFAQDAGRLAIYNRRAFLWESGVRLDLGTLPGHASSTALDINRSGQVVGWSGTADGSVSRAFLWEYGGMRDLGALPNDASSQALGINASGQVVGWSGTPDRSVSRAVFWQGGWIVDLNSVLSRGSGWVLTEARAINDEGQIVGTGLRNGQVRAFRLEPGD